MKEDMQCPASHDSRLQGGTSVPGARRLGRSAPTQLSAQARLAKSEGERLTAQVPWDLRLGRGLVRKNIFSLRRTYTRAFHCV